MLAKKCSLLLVLFWFARLVSPTQQSNESADDFISFRDRRRLITTNQRRRRVPRPPWICRNKRHKRHSSRFALACARAALIAERRWPPRQQRRRASRRTVTRERVGVWARRERALWRPNEIAARWPNLRARARREQANRSARRLGEWSGASARAESRRWPASQLTPPRWAGDALRRRRFVWRLAIGEWRLAIGDWRLAMASNNVGRK